MTRALLLLAMLLLAAPGAAAQAPGGSETTPGPAREPVRGITISTHGIGREWADERIMKPTFAKIRAVGAGWVALHPYARIRADGTVTWRWRRDRDRDEEVPPYWVEPVRLAHAQGLKVLIKPHLAYWGSPFRWRGDIEFKTDEDWTRFFADYRKWILAVARACKDADGFVVGTELDRTFGFEKKWRGIIAAVREETKAPLTYAANWSDYRRVPFWDALDVIGIQAYFPLTAKPDPDRELLDAAWKKQMRELRAFADKAGRDIVFTELGYDRSLRAASHPWEPRRDGAEAAALQRRCLSAALAAIEKEPRVLGSFLWKWFPEPRPVGRDFQLATPELRKLITRQWRAPKRSR